MPRWGRPSDSFSIATIPTCLGAAASNQIHSLKVVMPTHGFAQTAALFEHAIKKLIAASVVTQAEYDKMLADIQQVNRSEEETKSG